MANIRWYIGSSFTFLLSQLIRMNITDTKAKQDVLCDFLMKCKNWKQLYLKVRVHSDFKPLPQPEILLHTEGILYMQRIHFVHLHVKQLLHSFLSFQDELNQAVSSQYVICNHWGLVRQTKKPYWIHWRNSGFHVCLRYLPKIKSKFDNLFMLVWEDSKHQMKKKKKKQATTKPKKNQTNNQTPQ